MAPKPVTSERVFDPTRGKSVAGGPEEKVRQAVLSFLMNDKHVPAGLIAVEKAVSDLEQDLRADIVVYNRQGDPWMLVECKAPTVRITQSTFDQIARYNRTIRAPLMLVTNGESHYCCLQSHSTGGIAFLPLVPEFPDVPDIESIT